MTSPYADVGRLYLERGYSAIPIVPGEKRPGEFTNGEWRGMMNWQRFCDRPPTKFEYGLWETWPDAGVCVALGRSSNLIAIDFDYGTDSVRAVLEALLPPSSVRKTGKKGYTAFYRYIGADRMGTPLESRKYVVAKQSVIEVLSHGKQTVLPPTIHPDGMPYKWLTTDTLEHTIASELPLLPSDLHEKITAALRPFQTEEDVAGPAPRSLQSAEGSYWREINDRAMADFSCWVPKLLPHAKPNRAGNYRVIAHWRDCEKPNVSIHREGITDWGLGQDMTPLDLVMNATGSDLEAATNWLKELVGMPNLASIPIPAMKAVAQEAPGPAPAAVTEIVDPMTGEITEEPVASLPAVQASPPAPAGFFSCQGAVGMLFDFINRTSRRPQPVLALAASLCALGALMGRKYRTPTNLRSNLYAISVADSGAGKNHAREIVDRVFHEAGLSAYIGGNKIASGAGLLSAALRHPATLFMQDEFGMFLSAAADRKRSPKHITEILDNLTELYTTAGSTWRGTEYADQRERPKRDIINPCVCVYGTATPQTLWGSLSSSNAVDGSLARFLIFVTEESYPMPEDVDDISTPPGLIEMCQRIAAQNGNLGDVLAGDAPPGPPVTVPYSDEARALAKAFEQFCTHQLRDAAGTAYTAVLARQWEMTMKVALIHSVGRNPENPRIEAGDFEWAKLVVQRSIDMMVEGIDRFVADNQQDANTKKVLDIVRGAGVKGITRSALYNRTHFLGRDREYVIKGLIESEQIKADIVSGKTRPMTVYTLGR